jgi:hypothetical protein
MMKDPRSTEQGLLSSRLSREISSVCAATGTVRLRQRFFPDFGLGLFVSQRRSALRVLRLNYS